MASIAPTLDAHDQIGQNQTGKLAGVMPRSACTVVVTLAFVVAGCGESSHRKTATSAEDAADVAVAKAAERTATRRDARRAASIKDFYDRNARQDPINGDYSVRRVSVDAGKVTIRTNLNPDEEGETFFVGACTWMFDWGPWVERIEVLGNDGYSHALWEKGDAVCRVLGLDS